jgi:hypothetical protein
MSYVTEGEFYSTNVMQNNQIARNTQAIGLHSDQLIELGQKQTKIGADLTYFGNKVTELDATNQAQYGNIEELYLNHADQQTQINEAKAERDAIQAKLSSHSHEGGGVSECGMFDIPCKLRTLTGQVGTVALLAGGGFILYKVLTRGKK